MLSHFFVVERKQKKIPFQIPCQRSKRTLKLIATKRRVFVCVLYSVCLYVYIVVNTVLLLLLVATNDEPSVGVRSSTRECP